MQIRRVGQKAQSAIRCIKTAQSTTDSQVPDTRSESTERHKVH